MPAAGRARMPRMRRSTAAWGFQAVVFGPGAIEQAHTAEEWIPLDQLQQAADILYDFIKTWRPL